MDNTYLAHFGLVEEPYSTSPNPRYLYISPTHNLALEKTKWTITTKRGLSLVFGPVGTGKTTLARELAQRLEENPGVSYVFITNPNFPTPNQLLRAINQEFEVPQSSKSYLDLLSIFKKFLMTQALTQQKTLVLIIDEAQTLKAPLLELLRQLMNYESNDQKFLQVALFAQEEFRARLQHPRFRNLVNRAAMSSSLENLSAAPPIMFRPMCTLRSPPAVTVPRPSDNLEADAGAGAIAASDHCRRLAGSGRIAPSAGRRRCACPVRRRYRSSYPSSVSTI
jgi:general secretion pathway protein A